MNRRSVLKLLGIGVPAAAAAKALPTVTQPIADVVRMSDVGSIPVAETFTAMTHALPTETFFYLKTPMEFIVPSPRHCMKITGIMAGDDDESD